MQIDTHFLVSATATFIFSFFTAIMYYRKFFKRDIAVAIVVYSLFIFCIVFFVSFESSIGLGIGLLGILSLLRLRSTPENLIDIGFIFYSITIGLLNASISDLITIPAVDFILTFVLMLAVSNFLFPRQIIKTEIVFDEIFLDKLDDINLLKKKIKETYKINPISINIDKIDHIKDSITLQVSYDASDN